MIDGNTNMSLTPQTFKRKDRDWIDMNPVKKQRQIVLNNNVNGAFADKCFKQFDMFLSIINYLNQSELAQIATVNKSIYRFCRQACSQLPTRLNINPLDIWLRSFPFQMTILNHVDELTFSSLKPSLITPLLNIGFGIDQLIKLTYSDRNTIINDFDQYNLSDQVIKKIQALSPRKTELDLGCENLTSGKLCKIIQWIENTNKLELIQELTIESNQVEFLPNSIVKLKSLKSLNISYNKCRLLPTNFQRLTEIVSFNAIGNEISELPEGVFEWKYIKYLHLQSNLINAISDKIENLSTLNYLNLSSNQLTVIPSSVSRLSELRELHLYANKICRLPDNFGELKLLYFLNLSCNKLNRVPESVGDMSSLENLDLKYNDLDSLPSSFENLKSLIKIYFDEEKVTQIPDGVRTYWKQYD
jgi:hypothetical protein